jgi:hypothetical protein
LGAKLKAGCLYSKCFVTDIRSQNKRVNKFIATIFLALLAAGCATSTIEKRRQERATTYHSLPAETRSLVDQGQIKIGMPMDAVYIAWGRPTQTVQGQASDGTATTTWIYHGTTWREHRYWSYHYYPHGGYGSYATPTLDYDYIPQSYVAAEVVFENGVVKTWRNVSQPQPY